jgi:TPR repeat protein
MAYESGDGVTRDYGRARRWYERAAAEGNAQVYMKLARLSFLGLDGAKNEAEGASWVKKAAETGSEEASGLLGALYYGGIGVKQDFDEAAKWLKTSADADARSLAAKIETDAALNANLPPEEREARRQQAYAGAETQIRALLGKILARSAPPTRAQKQ